MNRKRLSALILTAGLIIGGTTLHNNTIQHNKVLLTSQQSESTTHKVANEKNLTSNGLEIAYIGTGEPTYNFSAKAGQAIKNENSAPLSFASPLQKKLYEYLSKPENQKTTMDTAIDLHNGDPENTCVLFQSSALRANGFEIPKDTAYTTVFMGNLLRNGWERRTDFENLQPGDICFAGVYHTFMFMGWADKEHKLAYVMGNEAYMNSEDFRERHLNGYHTPDKNQYKTTSYYKYVGKPSKSPILSAKITGSANLKSKANDKGSIVGKATYGQKAAILDQDGFYYKVDINGTIGWIPASEILPTGILKDYKGDASTDKPDVKPDTKPVEPSKPVVKPDTKPIVKPEAQKKYIKVTSNNGLWLLAGPNRNSEHYKVMPNNTKLEVLGTSGSWTKVNYNGTIGWCFTQYTTPLATSDSIDKPVKPTPIPPKPAEQEQTYKVTSNNGLWLLGGPSRTANHLFVMPSNAKIKVLEVQGQWTKVNYNGTTGWCFNQYIAKVENNKPNPVKPINPSIQTGQAYKVTSNNGLWLLAGPNAHSEHFFVMPSNAKITVLEVQGNWSKVNYNGTIGWCFNQYIAPQKGQAPVIKQNFKVTSNNGLWLLAGPNAHSEHFFVMPGNAKIELLENNGNWSKVNYNGTIGWCFNQYITRI